MKDNKMFDILLVGGSTNPLEKYDRQIGIMKPQFSGWKFPKYLSCHHSGLGVATSQPGLQYVYGEIPTTHLHGFHC